MTREDIVNSYSYKVAKASVDYSQKYAKDDKLQGIVMDTFEDAADFGYNLAIEKACDWLKDYAHMFVSETTGDLTEDELINAFRKAMKGEQI